MLLSELGDVVSIRVLRDGEFKSLGVLSHSADGLLVGLYDSDYLHHALKNNQITCVITSESMADQLPSHWAIGVCEDPMDAFYKLHIYLRNETDFYWTDFDTELSPEAVIADEVYVAPKNVRIGRLSVVEPNATILEQSIIGEGVIIRAGTVIGGEGFEPKRLGGKDIMIPHAGGVKLHDRVEIQGNSHVQRASYGRFTEVGEETKVGTLANIAHHVRIGCRCKISAGVVICGSTSIGDDVSIGPQSIISSEINIEDNAIIKLGSVVTRDMKENNVAVGRSILSSRERFERIKGL